MSDRPAPRAFEVRHVQMARAAFAALAAIMITFSPDHSAAVGLSVFSGFAIATGFILLLAAWLVYPAGSRVLPLLFGILTVVAGMAGALDGLRTTTGFFAIVISWALVTGLFETVVSARALRAHKPIPLKPGHVAPWDDGRPAYVAPRSEARDGLVIGIVTIVLGLALLLVPTGYALQYTVEEAHETYTLTGITIGVGLFGGYAAIVAVYLAIAAFSPRRSAPVAAPDAADSSRAPAPADQKDTAP